MNKYLIWYSGYKPESINDVIQANSKLDACKKFIIACNGSVFVHKVEVLK